MAETTKKARKYWVIFGFFLGITFAFMAARYLNSEKNKIDKTEAQNQIENLTVASFASPNISQWTNDSGYLAKVDYSQLQNGSGIFMDYRPNNGQCSNNQILKYDLQNNRWVCGNEGSGTSSSAWGAITGTLTDQADLKNALNSKLSSSTSIGGDVSGTISNISVSDDSHSHTGATISNLTTSDFTSGNISQWTNDSHYLTGVNISQIENGTGLFLDYRPDNTACTQNQVLKYDASLSRWVCGVDSGAGAVAWGDISGDMTLQSDLNTALTNKLGTTASFGGDVTGNYDSLIVTDDSHNHTGATISDLTTADFTSQNISQWTNDSHYITDDTSVPKNNLTNAGALSFTWSAAELVSQVMVEGENISLLNNNSGFITGVNQSQVANGSGVYWNYKPNDTACAQNQVLKYDASLTRWTCANDTTGASTWGSITGTLSSQSDLNTALGNKLDSSASFGGDVSGTYNSLAITNDSHNHTGSTISGLAASNFTSQNISQWTNDSNFISGVNFSQVANGTGVYLDYKPNNTACDHDQVLKYDAALTRWVCANDNGAGTIAWGSINGTLSDQGDLSTALSSKLATTANYGGDASGTYDNIAIANDSHNHTGSTISGLAASNFTSQNISQWTNDSNFITGVDISQIANGSGKYFNYKPNDTACTNNQILKYETSSSRWICANDDAGTGGGGGLAVNIQQVSGSTDVSTTSTTFEDLPDMAVTMTTTGGPIEMTFSGAVGHSVSGGVAEFRIILDGVQQGGASVTRVPQATTGSNVNLVWTATPASGSHTIKVQWQTEGSGTVYNRAALGAEHRTLIVKEFLGSTSSGGGQAINFQQASGTTDVSTSNTSFEDMPDMSITMTTSGNPVEINFSTGLGITGGSQGTFRILVDDVQVGSQDNVNDRTDVHLTWLQALSAGSHTIKAQWKVSGNIGYNRPAIDLEHRILTVKEFLGGSGGSGGSITVGSMTGTSVFSDSTASNDWLGMGDSAGRIQFEDDTTDKILLLDANVGVGQVTPTHKLDVNGNIGLAASGYVNFGATDGDTGYGIRDNGGAIEYKDSAGNWIALNTLGTGGSGGAANDYILIRDEKPSGSAGGSFDAGSWVTRDLNTEVMDTGNLSSVTNNQITLAPGTYVTHILAPAMGVGSHQAMLYNVTTDSVELLGTSIFSLDGNYVENYSEVIGEFTITQTTVFEVRHRASVSKGSWGLGHLAGFGQSEIFTVAEFQKINGGGGGSSGPITVGSMTGETLFADATASSDWLGLGATAGRMQFDDQTIDSVLFLDTNVGVGTSTPNHLLDVNGNLGIATSGYINFGATDGTSGYGFRDNAGTIEYKNSTGTWVALSSLTGGGGSGGGGVVASVTTVQTRTQDSFTATSSGNGSAITPLDIVFTPKKAGNKVVLEWIVNGEGNYDVVYNVTRNGVVLPNSNDGANIWSGINTVSYDVDVASTPTNDVIRIVDENSLDVESTYSILVRSSNVGVPLTYNLNRSFNTTGANQYESSMSSGVATEIDPSPTAGIGEVTVGSMTGTSVFADATASNDWLGLGNAAARIQFDDQATDRIVLLDANVGIGTSNPTHKLDINGNLGLAESGVINFGATDGDSGYGFRDNAGVMEYKDSTGNWIAFSSLIGGGAGPGSGNGLVDEKLMSSDLAVNAIADLPDLIITATLLSGHTYRWVYQGNGVKSSTGTPTVYLTDENDSVITSQAFSVSNGYASQAYLLKTETGAGSQVTRKIRADGGGGSFSFSTGTGYYSKFFLEDVTNTSNVSTSVGSMSGANVFADGSADEDWLGLGATAGRIQFDNQTTDSILLMDANIGIGQATPTHKLDVNGNIGLAASGYVNFGATDGTDGYGIRDNGGDVEVKNNNGEWKPIATKTGYILLQHQLPSGTEGGGATGNAWTTLDLNTEVTDTSNSCNLASNQFTLEAGTYEVDIDSTFYYTLASTIRLRNVSDNTTTLMATSIYVSTAGGSPQIRGRFTIATPKTFEIQYLVERGQSTYGLGVSVGARAGNYVESEVYRTVELHKIE